MEIFSNNSKENRFIKGSNVFVLFCVILHLIKKISIIFAIGYR